MKTKKRKYRRNPADKPEPKKLSPETIKALQEADEFEIDMEISPTGDFAMEVKGLKGKSCVPIAQPFEEIGILEEVMLTSEFDETPSKKKVKVPVKTKTLTTPQVFTSLPQEESQIKQKKKDSGEEEKLIQFRGRRNPLTSKRRGIRGRYKRRKNPFPSFTKSRKRRASKKRLRRSRRK